MAACPEGKFHLPRVRKRNKERRFTLCGDTNMLTQASLNFFHRIGKALITAK